MPQATLERKKKTKLAPPRSRSLVDLRTHMPVQEIALCISVPADISICEAVRDFAGRRRLRTWTEPEDSIIDVDNEGMVISPKMFKGLTTLEFKHLFVAKAPDPSKEGNKLVQIILRRGNSLIPDSFKSDPDWMGEPLSKAMKWISGLVGTGRIIRRQLAGSAGAESIGIYLTDVSQYADRVQVIRLSRDNLILEEYREHTS